MSSAACPSTDELQAFALGSLSERAFARVAEHLRACQHCEALLPTFDECSDGLLAGLRCLTAAEPDDAGTLPEALAKAARQVGQSSEVSLDSGRRYARQVATGNCRLGKFELSSELGAGSFGYVFRARDTELDRTVAVKIQRAGSLDNREEAARFLREARSVAQLKHPGIVSLYDIGQTEEGVCYLVTEFIDGQTLEARLK